MSAEFAAGDYEIVLKSDLFGKLNASAADAVFAHGEAVTFAPDEVILREGELELKIFVLVDGTAVVRKRDQHGEGEHDVAVVGRGDSLGELKLIERAPNTATVVARENVRAWSIGIETLEAIYDDDVRASGFVKAVARPIAKRLSDASSLAANALQKELEASKAREAAGRFIVYLFVGICAYVLLSSAIDLIPEGARPSALVLTPLLGLMNGIPIVLMLRRKDRPRSFYGLTLKNAGSDCLAALLWSIPACAAIVLIKAVFMQFDPALEGRPLFDWSGEFSEGSFSWAAYAIGIAAYVVTCPMQEFGARSGLQALLEQLVPSDSSGADWTAIFLSNLIFASAHTHIGFPFAVAAFVPGLFWGWLFCKHRSLVAVSLSHAIVGSFALFVVGIRPIIMRG